MTVTGRVVDDLPMLQNPWLGRFVCRTMKVEGSTNRLIVDEHTGGREHAFCLHTGSSMYVLAAANEKEKKKWIAEIEKVFSRFLNEQVRKVALMELSWEVS